MELPKPIVYVTRDKERALGMEEDENYAIISNQKDAPLLDTYELLQTEKVEETMRERKGAAILVFQNTARIERLCAEKKWPLLNPFADLSKKIEEKISQYEWLGDLQKYLPPTKV